MMGEYAENPLVNDLYSRIAELEAAVAAFRAFVRANEAAWNTVIDVWGGEGEDAIRQEAERCRAAVEPYMGEA